MMKTTLLMIALMLSFLTKAQESDPAIHVSIKGQGDPIVFIPGFTVPGNSWDPIVNELATNYECHTITLAGFGGKPPIDFPWLARVNSALDDYINQNELENATIIGHSLGGTIATWLASRDNEYISKIILVDALPAAGALMIPNFNPDHLVYNSPFNRQQLGMKEEDFENLARGMAQGMSLQPATQKRIKDWIMLADRETYVYGYTDYLKLDLREELRNIKVPVTIIAAEMPYGKEMVKQTYQNQYANLAQYDLIIAHQAAHFLMFDQAEWFMQQLHQSLANQ
jgi:pimeloyl-ACP methyl ester carboxylesterase